jgi:DNA-binding GntR family transcriptional regulator
MREGKYPRGSEHPQAKLNERIVKFIRESGDTIGELARRFGVCRKTLRKAKNGEHWKHV